MHNANAHLQKVIIFFMDNKKYMLIVIVVGGVESVNNSSIPEYVDVGSRLVLDVRLIQKKDIFAIVD